jgi:hypothetical protein
MKMDEESEEEKKKRYECVLLNLNLGKYLHEIIKNIDSLPDHAMQQPLTHYDLKIVLNIIQEIIKLRHEEFFPEDKFLDSDHFL